MDQPEPKPSQVREPARAEAEHDELGFDLPEPARPGKRTASLALLALLVVIGGAFGAGYLPKLRARHALEQAAARSAEELRTVEVLAPTRLDGSRTLVLPASVRPLAQTTLYPRADGYVKAFYKDLG